MERAESNHRKELEVKSKRLITMSYSSNRRRDLFSLSEKRGGTVSIIKSSECISYTGNVGYSHPFLALHVAIARVFNLDVQQ